MGLVYCASFGCFNPAGMLVAEVHVEGGISDSGAVAFFASACRSKRPSGLREGLRGEPCVAEKRDIVGGRYFGDLANFWPLSDMWSERDSQVHCSQPYADFPSFMCLP